MTEHSTEREPQETAALLPARPPSEAVAALATPVLYMRTRAAGLCSGEAADAARWFPPGFDGRTEVARQRESAYARAACLGCGVAEECLELALRAEAHPSYDPHGVFGGTAPWERRAMGRARAARSRAGAGTSGVTS